MTEEQKKRAAELRATFREQMADRGVWVESQVNTAFDILIDAIAQHMNAAPAPVHVIDAAQIDALVKDTVESIVARMQDTSAPPADRLAACSALMDAVDAGERAVAAAAAVPSDAKEAEPGPPATPAPSLDTMLAAASTPAAAASEAPSIGLGTSAGGNRRGRGGRGST
jgi:hypothetical protein